MLAVKGLFDGKSIKLLGRVSVKEPHEVIITFLEPDEDKVLNRDIRKLAEVGGSFDFLNNPAEDIYSDTDLKVRYKND
ncbi:MAG: hypothetical protein ABII25_03425 [bacterium]